MKTNLDYTGYVFLLCLSYLIVKLQTERTKGDLFVSAEK